MNKSIFVAGTDTDAGKTYVSCALLQRFASMGLTTFAMKPIASGANISQEGIYVNADALALQKKMTVHAHYHQINPIALPLAVAPHIAAAELDYEITQHQLVHSIMQGQAFTADVMLVEGIGGWHVPINLNHTMADVVVSLSMPVILVVGMRLGCLNHALLTVEVIKSKRVNLMGWIANVIDPTMHFINANIKTLMQIIRAPYLGIVEYNGDASLIDINNLWTNLI